MVSYYPIDKDFTKTRSINCNLDLLVIYSLCNRVNHDLDKLVSFITQFRETDKSMIEMTSTFDLRKKAQFSTKALKSCWNGYHGFLGRKKSSHLLILKVSLLISFSQQSSKPYFLIFSAMKFSAFSSCVHQTYVCKDKQQINQFQKQIKFINRKKGSGKR